MPGGIVEFGVRLDRRGHKATRTVQLLDVFQVVAETDCIRGLTRLSPDHLLQRLGGELVISGPLEGLQLVLLAGSDSEVHVDHRLVARSVFVFGRRLFHNLGLRLAEFRLQVSAGVVNREQLPLNQLVQPAAGIFMFRKPLASCFQCRNLGIACPRKFDVPHLNENIAHVVVDRFDGTIRLARAHVFNVTGDCIFHEHRLQDIGNLVGQTSEQRQLSIEQRRMLFDALEKFGVREPDEVFEAGGQKLIGVRDVKLELGSRRRVA